MHKPSLILRLAWQELRHGWKHFMILVACLTLGVAVMASVGSLGHMVERALNSEAQSLLGGDLEVRIRGREATIEQRRYLETHGRVSYAATMRSMLYSGEATSTLVELKAIDAAYPLLGELSFNEPISRAQIFADNGIAVDAILLSQLELELGDMVRLGDASYTIRATIKREPDRVVQLFSFGPRVMLSHEAMAESGLVNTFSLINHRYRIVVPEGTQAGETYEDALEEKLDARFPDVSWRVSSGTDGNRSVQRFIDQLLSFLTLSGLATFLIAGIGIGSSTRSYLEKKLPTMAVFKVLGARYHDVLLVYATVLGILALIGGMIGVAIAMAAIYSLIPLAEAILPVLEGKASVSPLPIALALWYGLVITYLFSLPALLSALKIRPSLLFRSKGGLLLFRLDKTVWWVMGGLTALLSATLVLTAQDPFFMLGALGMMVLCFALFGACTLVVRHIARRMRVKQPWLRLAVGNLHRPGSTSGTVIYAIGISLTVLIALTLTEANFQERIRQVVEEDAPSLFMLDIQPHQEMGLSDLLHRYADDANIMLYPMVRGQISEINGEPVDPANVDDDIRWAVRGDRGLSYSATPPDNAELVLGEWWSEDYDGPPLLSVDERFISGMDLSLGDTITLNILGEDITAQVANARDIDYSTLQINFALMLSPGVIDDFPRTSLSTVYLGAQAENELVRRIAREFPGVTVIRTREVVELVRSVIGHVATALRLTVAISLIAGLMVLTSALSATLEQRMYDTAILKVLGARQRDILKSCTAEWMLLALVTALIAGVIGTVSSWLIVERFRAQDFFLMPHVTLLTILLCIAVIWITGFIGNRRLFHLRPAGLLRND